MDNLPSGKYKEVGPKGGEFDSGVYFLQHKKKDVNEKNNDK